MRPSRRGADLKGLHRHPVTRWQRLPSGAPKRTGCSPSAPSFVPVMERRTSVKRIRGAYRVPLSNSTNQHVSSTAGNEIEWSYMCQAASSANQERDTYELQLFLVVKCCSLLSTPIHWIIVGLLRLPRCPFLIALGARLTRAARPWASPRVEPGAPLGPAPSKALPRFPDEDHVRSPACLGLSLPSECARTVPPWPKWGSFTVLTLVFPGRGAAPFEERFGTPSPDTGTPSCGKMAAESPSALMLTCGSALWRARPIYLSGIRRSWHDSSTLRGDPGQCRRSLSRLAASSPSGCSAMRVEGSLQQWEGRHRTA